MARAARRQRDFPNANDRAKRLRRTPTPAERAMWRILDDVPGFHFRRQVALGPLVYDFGEHGARLLVEVDGGVHDMPFAIDRDKAKDEAAKALGYHVVRVPNAIVLKEPGLALALILQCVRGDRPPPPTPPHKGEGSTDIPPAQRDPAR